MYTLYIYIYTYIPPYPPVFRCALGPRAALPTPERRRGPLQSRRLRPYIYTYLFPPPLLYSDTSGWVNPRSGRVRIYLRLSGGVGHCSLGICDRRGGVLGCGLSLNMVVGLPFALRASCFATCVVLGQPVSPVQASVQG